jgi:hypothetical protein
MQPNEIETGPANSDLLAGGDLDDGLPDEVRGRVKAELQPGERLLWTGRSFPPPELIAVWHIVLVVIGLILIAFGTAGIIHALRDTRARVIQDSTMPTGLALSSIGCIVIVCTIGGWVAGRFQRSNKARIYYAVTDRRAITWIPEPRADAVRVRSVPRGQFKDVVRVERPDGSGSLEFSYYDHVSMMHWQHEGFQHIHEVRRVEQIIRNYLMTTDARS